MKQDKTLDTRVDEEVKEETAQSKIVSSLIDVRERQDGKIGSDIELKTDLSEDEIKLHTVINMMGHILETAKIFGSDNILHNLIELKERKSLSKERLSRKEAVEIARTPEMPILSGFNTQENFTKRWFSSKRRV
jgi:hypothetical protein